MTRSTRKGQLISRSLPLCAVGISTLFTTACWSSLDGPPDVPADQDPPCALRVDDFRVHSAELPTSLDRARNIAFDMDQDDSARPENAIGAVLATFGGNLSPNTIGRWQTEIDAALGSVRAPWILRVERCAAGSDPFLRVSLHVGHDVDGDGVLEIQPDGATGAVGRTDAGGTLLAKGGLASAPIAVLFDPRGAEADAGFVSGVALRVELNFTPTGALDGRIGLAVGQQAAMAAAAVPMATFYTQLIAENDTDLGLVFDENMDGTVTPEEFLRNEIVLAFGAADVDMLAFVDGETVYWPLHDGENDSLSLALHIQAAPIVTE